MICTDRGSLLDRIDLHIEVPSINYKELSSDAAGETSEAVRARVEEAREVQIQRFIGHPGVVTNSAMPSRLVREFARLDARCESLLEHAMTELNFSARAHDRILKVSRTLADLAGADQIREPHLLEAIQFRTLDRNLWG